MPITISFRGRGSRDKLFSGTPNAEKIGSLFRRRFENFAVYRSIKHIHDKHFPTFMTMKYGMVWLIIFLQNDAIKHRIKMQGRNIYRPMGCACIRLSAGSIETKYGISGSI